MLQAKMMKYQVVKHPFTDRIWNFLLKGFFNDLFMNLNHIKTLKIKEAGQSPEEGILISVLVRRWADCA
ncbi:MAG: hypothetical protein JWO44_2488 [Bacteroidetes bacterium]|jgi:hypothetical protein|nr:hypothetical protein [Bacteroidota bacterium]